jgi:hypothetical protein
MAICFSTVRKFMATIRIPSRSPTPFPIIDAPPANARRPH